MSTSIRNLAWLPTLGHKRPYSCFLTHKDTNSWSPEPCVRSPTTRRLLRCEAAQVTWKGKPATITAGLSLHSIPVQAPSMWVKSFQTIPVHHHLSLPRWSSKHRRTKKAIPAVLYPNFCPMESVIIIKCLLLYITKFTVVEMGDVNI